MYEVENRSKDTSIEQEKTTFVFVSPWTWDSSKKEGKLEDFENSLKAKQSWKNIIYIDGVKLATWLDSCPAVAAWHARNTLRSTPYAGIRSTDEFWADFVGRFDPKLVERVLLAGRDSNALELIDDLMRGPGPIRITADSTDEAIAFSIAAIRLAKREVRLFLEARTIVVDTLTAAREVVGNRNLIFLLSGEAASSPGQFYDRAPTLIPLGRRQKSGISKLLRRPTGHELAKALEELGLSEGRALTYARGSGRSLSALQRLIPSGSYIEPNWCSVRGLYPAILAGAWDDRNDADREIIQRLSGVSDYEDYIDSLHEYREEDDPPFVVEGGIWKVNAPIDAFTHTAARMTPKLFTVFEQCFTEVFSNLEQREEEEGIPLDRKRYESRYSEWLREGLANTLLMISALGDKTDLKLRGETGRIFADRIISGLPALNGHSELLSCIENDLPLLAEASPGPFLQALERWLEGSPETLRAIFSEEEGAFAPITYHTGLLWALETLLWHENSVARAMLVLARLAEIDPGGRLVNRSINSLKEAFLPWRPNTCAKLEQRNAVLSKLAECMPNVAWPLLVDLLPNRMSASTGTRQPWLRDHGRDSDTTVTKQEYREATSKVIELVLILVAEDTARWCIIIGDIPNFPEADMKTAIGQLRVALENLAERKRLPIWNALRDLTNKHRRFSESAWSLTQEQLAPFEELVAAFEPRDPIMSKTWIFDTWDFATEDGESVDDRRVSTLVDLFNDMGVQALVDMGNNVKRPTHLIGAMEQAGFDLDVLAEVLESSLKNVSEKNLQFCAGISNIIWLSAGRTKAENLLERTINALELDDNISARLILWWPMEPDTWYFARRLGRGVFDRYWSLSNGYRLKGETKSYLRGLLYFLRAGRGSAFLEAMNHRLSEVPSRLILRGLKVLNNELSSRSADSGAMISHHLNTVFAELDTRTEVDDSELIAQEILLLPLLEDSSRQLRIHQRMAVDASLYHEVISVVFRSDNSAEKAVVSDQERVRWNRAYSILSKFHTLPGLTGADINADTLRDWVDNVRQMSALSGHSAIADIYVGHLFAHSPADEDGVWPHRVVRDEIERLGSSSLEKGIATERYNMRGVTVRGVYDGGDQERELAEKYENDMACLAQWPRTAAVLGAIAQRWRLEADDHDTDAELRKLRS